MAKLDDLIAHVADGQLRGQLSEAVAELRRHKKFGLVYEQHIPEMTLLPSAGVSVGSTVIIRTEPGNKTRYSVEHVNKSTVTIAAGAERWDIPMSDLLVVVPFGEPVFPILQPSDTPVIRSVDKPFHIVINGENFHSLQLLMFSLRRKIDCIYIDPPYNTGDPNWKYNNDFVDSNDRFQHSKWLSFMEKRLRLAESLLKPNGVLIVTIDEHEAQNLGVLLRQTLKRVRDIQMVTIVTNTAGSMSPGKFSRAEEYAFFCFFGNSKPAPMETDMLANSRPTTQFWFPLFRSRGLNDRPSRRPNLVYPIAINPESLAIAGTGRSLQERRDAGEVAGDLDEWKPDRSETLDGNPVVWPILDSGEVTTWQLGQSKLLELYQEGFVRIRKPRSEGGPRPFTLSYVKSGNQRLVREGKVVVSGREPNGAYILQGSERTTIPKSTWKVANHDARLYGTTMLRSLIGQSFFQYPKSPYATADALMTVVADKPNALVLDFFAGSGTTLQAVAMLNAKDEGKRQCILVTNNEVSYDLVDSLASEGYFPRDAKYEERGIYKSVTVPRVKAALTGLMPNGTPVEGQYEDGSDLSDGFEENAYFFDMAYADPNQIEVGISFESIVPSLWIASGAIGDLQTFKVDPGWLLPENSPFAVLLEEDHFKTFQAAIDKRPDISHIWLVTDSADAFARMRAQIKSRRFVGMLYRDYLRNFRINVEATAPNDPL